MDVSIIIVNYKTPQLLFECVDSLYKFVKDSTFEIIIVDNNSQDESKERIMPLFPDVIWVDSPQNVGFGAANNLGIKIAKGQYTLLLNSDTEFYEDALTPTLIHFKTLEKRNGKVGLLGCQIMYKNRELQPSCNYFWAGIREAVEEHPIGIKVFQHWLKVKKLRSISKFDRLDTNHKITWLGVPFALIKTNTIQENPFDENFFLYSEDEELNFRLVKAGYPAYFFSETGVYHHIGASSGVNDARDKQLYYSKLMFILKARGKLYFSIYCAIMKSVYKFNKRLSGGKMVKEELWLKDGKKAIPSVIGTKTQLNCYNGDF